MSNISWLPPLNNPHRSSQTTVKIQQFIPNYSDDVSLPYPVLHLFAFADFESDSQDARARQKRFHGLQVHFILDEPSICSVNYFVTACLPSIESSKNQIIFSMKHLDEQEFSSQETVSCSGHELFYRINNFMIDAVAKKGSSHDVYFDLEIRMDIIVPDDELKSWHSWFDAKDASDPDFRFEFGRALSRLRTEEELLDEYLQTRRFGSLAGFEVIEAAIETENSCSICLEEFPAGCKVTKLQCGHLFHETCITMWLRDNYVCPICRFDVQNSSIDK